MLQPGAQALVAMLQEMGIDVSSVSGDRDETVRQIAKIVGIADHRGNARREDKRARIAALQRDGAIVAMVGDGVNDAPALAAADVSFAIGTGSDVAVDTADITVVRNDLNAVVDAILLSRATLAKIRQNLFFAFVYNVLGIPLAALGMLNPVFAGAAMAASSLSVVGNALLLRRWRPKQ